MLGLFSISLSLLFSALSYGVEKDLRSINLIVKTPFNTPKTANLFLTGEGDSFCNWDPKCIKINKISAQTYKLNLVLIDKPKLLEFKITRGSWKNEACSQLGKPLANFELMTSGGSVDYTITIENWCDKSSFGLPSNVVELKNFRLNALGLQRDIKVYLPSTYNKYTKKKFPVIYMHDGQNTLDPKTSAFGKEWGVDETIETLISRKLSKGFIVVAIPCHCRERSDEYNYFLKGDLYAQSIVESLIPYIDMNFRTITTKLGRYTMGSSMGALISFSLLWEYPHVFKAAAGLSFPAFAYEFFIFDVATKFKVPGDTFFYLDHGGRGQDATYAQSRNLFLDHLNSRGVWPHQIVFRFYPYDGHNEVDWANRVNIPLMFFERILKTHNYYN